MVTKMRRLQVRVVLAPLFALALLFWIGTPASGQTTTTQNGDTTRGELAGMDRFLDSHPEIAEQLRKDPSLINNGEFVEKHAALQEYLQEHPEMREEFSEHPNAFMRQEERFDRQEENRDSTRRQLAGMDRFLDSHPEIAEQLRRDPSLINNGEFVEKHAALQEYLQKHPEMREKFGENPNAFMRQEERFDRREGDRDRDGDNRIKAGNPGEGNSPSDPDGRGELTSFGQFLGGHASVAKQLSKDPSLVNNREYRANHPEIGDYLKAHPAMTQQLAKNPQGVMSSSWVEEAKGTGTKVSSPKPKANQ